MSAELRERGDFPPGPPAPSQEDGQEERILGWRLSDPPVLYERGWPALRSCKEVKMQLGTLQQADELPQLLGRLGLIESRPVLVLLGGASGLSDEDFGLIRPVFASILPVLESLQVTVVDGGTDAGVMRLVGEGRAASGASFPLVGVVAAGTVGKVHPSGSAREVSLDSNHTHFILVPGEEWGDESVWLYRVAECLAGDRTILSLLINGGEVALEDAGRSVDRGHPVLVVDGTGRLADQLAAALKGEPSPAGSEAVTSSSLVQGVSARSPRLLARRIRAILEER